MLPLRDGIARGPWPSRQLLLVPLSAHPGPLHSACVAPRRPHAACRSAIDAAGAQAIGRLGVRSAAPGTACATSSTSNLVAPTAAAAAAPAAVGDPIAFPAPARPPAAAASESVADAADAAHAARRGHARASQRSLAGLCAPVHRDHRHGQLLRVRVGHAAHARARRRAPGPGLAGDSGCGAATRRQHRGARRWACPMAAPDICRHAERPPPDRARRSPAIPGWRCMQCSTAMRPT